MACFGFFAQDNAHETALKQPVEGKERASHMPASAVIFALQVDLISAVAKTLLVGFFVLFFVCFVVCILYILLQTTIHFQYTF